MIKLKEQIKAALRAKSNAQAAHAAAVMDYQAALSELASLKFRWHCGQIAQRTYQVYKADTRELRKDLERDAVGYKKEVHLAHDEHDRLLTEYAEELRKTKNEYAEGLVKAKGRVEYLLSSMCPEDIEALKQYFEG